MYLGRTHASFERVVLMRDETPPIRPAPALPAIERLLASTATLTTGWKTLTTKMQAADARNGAAVAALMDEKAAITSLIDQVEAQTEKIYAVKDRIPIGVQVAPVGVSPEQPQVAEERQIVRPRYTTSRMQERVARARAARATKAARATRATNQPEPHT
jgi:hypothetical protein